MNDGAPENGGGAPPDMTQSMMGPATGASADEKTHALLSWILMIVTAGFIAPLIFFLIDKDKPFVYRHAAMGLSLCILAIPVSICVWILAFLFAMAGPLIVLIIPIWLVLAIAWFGTIIMGAIAANNGQQFSPPIVSSVCKAIFHL